MANEQQQQNARLLEAKRLIEDINRLRGQMNQEPLKLGDTEAVNNMQSLRNEFKQLASDIENVDNSATNLFQQMVGIAKEFGAVNAPAKQLKSAFRGLVEQASKLKNDELGLVDLRTRDLETIQKKLGLQNEAARIAASQFEGQRASYDAALAVKQQEADLQSHINNLNQQAADLEEEGNDNGALIKLSAVEKYEEDLIKLKRKRLNLESKIEDEAAAAFAYLDDSSGAYSKINTKVTERLGVEKEVSRLTGVTGALVGGTGALMERLGMRSGIFHDAMKDSAEEMRKMAKSTAEGGESFNKLQIAAKGFSVLAEGFAGALNDPASAALAIVTSFLEVNKAQTEFIQLTGQSAASLGGVNTEVATMTDLLKTAASFTKQTGLNAAAIFTPQQIGQIADATELLGISAEQGVKLGMIMKQTGKSANDIGDAIYANVDAGIANKVVYDDVLSASDDIVASSGGNVEALGRAASAARKLGLDLTKVNQIADGLLDFETSIESELEAQLLTGKNINLSKARELALNNDLEGVAKELEKNGASAAEFAKMNRIQQQALAKAMGMSREELGKMVLTKEAMADMSADEIANARGMTLEQSKQMDIQSRIKKSMDRLAQAFAPILEAVVPIVEALLTIVRPIASAIGYLLKFKAVSIALTTVLAGIATFFAAKKIANFVGVGIKGFNAMRASMSDMGEGLKPLKALFGKAGKSITDSFSKGLGDKTKVAFDKNVNRFRDQATGKFVSADKAKELGAKMPDSLKKSGDTVGDLSKKTEDVKADSGAGIRGFLKGLGDGLASIGRQLKDVVKGAIAIGVAGLALGGSFALALKMVENVDPVQMIAFAGAISMFGLTLALLGKIGNDVIKGALALGILGVGLIPAAYAFSLLAGVDAGSMFAFAGALSLLGLAAAGLGFLFPYIAMGAGALALLGLALIPAAYGFSLIQGLDMDTILGFAKGVGVLAATTAALGLVAPLIMYGSLALAALGLALIPLSYGFAALGDTPIESIINKIQGLATLAPQLLLVGAGLMGIAAGLGMIAISGIAAIPALAALSAFALVASPLAALGGLFGDGGGEEDNSMAEISSKLDTLISVVSAGGNVYLDGDKVGEAQVLGTYKLS